MRNKTDYKELYAQSQLVNAGLITMLDCANGNKKFNPREVNIKKYTKMLGVEDSILCSNRYEWKNLNANIRSSQLENLIYQNGAICIFKEAGYTWYTRFSLQGKLNPMGALQDIIPIDYAGKRHGIKKGVLLGNMEEPSDIEDVAIILQDYTSTFNQNLIESRQSINSGTTIADQSKVYKQLMNALQLTAKKAIARAETESQKKAILDSVKDFYDNDDAIGVIVDSNIRDLIEILNVDTKFDIEPFMQALESYKRVRLNFNGIPSKNPYEKRERALTGEIQNDDVNIKLIAYDGLYNRQGALDLGKKYGIFDNSVTVDFSQYFKEWIEPKQNDFSMQIEKGGDNENDSNEGNFRKQ